MSYQQLGSQYPGQWCAWNWSPEHGCYVRSRETAPGVYGWEYSEYLPTEGNPPPIVQSTPRSRETDPAQVDVRDSSDAVPEITGRLQSTSLGGSKSGSSRSRQGKSTDKVPTSDAAPPKNETPVVHFNGPNYTKITTRSPDKNHEKDRNFKVHGSEYFEFGKVFKVLWSEPIGSGGTVITVANQQGFQKVRRFVVIDKRRGHSICLPILTYGGQATLKSGAHGEDHAAVYSNHHKKSGPTVLEKERMTKKPIKIDIRLGSEKLDPLSRLNYAKVYTVEHNVKVNFIGQVNRRYEQQVVLDYNKTHGPIADRPYEIRRSAEEYRLDETRNSEGTNPYQSNQEPFDSQGEYKTSGGPSQSSWEPNWNASGSQAPRSTGFGQIATSSYNQPEISTWGDQAANTTQDPLPPHDSSLYDAD
ncbi:hypothetical protein DL95DRAFT_528272 [Leptodontidium sp. 2 PMI_412]|nr:hypothetical protein DL95DRAFT_528272 [Leptodontidium sp. 2 PMI_412]